MKNGLNTTKQKAFSLIEVMIAIVVFAFGMLGIAGLATVSVKSNHNGYMRSQASFFAQSILDSMRNNSWSVWNGNYNGTFTANSSVVNDCGTAATACDCAQVAARDIRLLQNQLAQSLNNVGNTATATINCNNGGFTYGSYACGDSDLPYRGMCTITINWQEANYKGVADAQVFTLVARP